ncbi:hypothetical protein JW935_16585 [candidate division KSB1 bacterium]|nr:hypothetical protein [candidate division KSB1 bacterium]
MNKMCIKNCRMYIVILLVSLRSFFAFGDTIPSPYKFFGFHMGEPDRLVNYRQIRAYFKKCETSPRLRVLEVGETTLGNTLILAVISDPDNLTSLDSYIAAQQQICDAAGIDSAKAYALMEKIPIFVSINCSIHADEIGPSLMSVELAYQLLTQDTPAIRKVLKNVVLLLLPAHNPDGLDKIVDWQKKHAGTKYQNGPFPFLYHHYCGHDINRDWFALTQKETRATVENVYNVFRPQIVLDLHQMGSLGPRLVLPPYVDPYDKAIDPIVQAQMTAIGTSIAADLTAKDFAGVGFNLFFDSYSPGRSYTNTHGGMRILCEIASAKLASPIDIPASRLKKWQDFDPVQRSWRFPKPWAGGEWSLKNIVDYALQTSFSLLIYAAENRKNCQTKMYQVLRKSAVADTGSVSFIISQQQHDPWALYEMLKALQTGLVRIHQSLKKIELDRTYPPGTYVVQTAQPYGNYAATLLGRREYPGYEKEGQSYPVHPYDVTSHNLPLLFGVRTQVVKGEIQEDLVPVQSLPVPKGIILEEKCESDFYIDYRNLQAVRCLQYLYDQKVGLFWEMDSVRTKSFILPPGAIRVETKDSEIAGKVADRFCVNIFSHQGQTSSNALRLYRPRIGLYQSYLARMSEGWMRFVLDEYDIQYNILTDQLIKSGFLEKKYDVIILPDQSASDILNGASEINMPAQYCGGIGENGRDNLSKFVQDGGILVAVGRATELPLQHFWLGAKNAVKELKKTEYYAPGCLLKVIVDTRHPLGFGLTRETSAFSYFCPVFDLVNGHSIAHYPGENILLDGWLTGEKHLALRTAVAEIPYGKGRVLLYGLRPMFRAQTIGTFKLIFNALIYSGVAKKERFSQ